jgi:hypothetical protein
VPSPLFLPGSDYPAQALEGLGVLRGRPVPLAPPVAHVVEGLSNHLVLPTELCHRGGLVDDVTRGHVLGTDYDLELRPPNGWVRVERRG